MVYVIGVSIATTDLWRATRARIASTAINAPYNAPAGIYAWGRKRGADTGPVFI